MVSPKGPHTGPTSENMALAEGKDKTDEHGNDVACRDALYQVRTSLATATGSSKDVGKKAQERLAVIESIVSVVEPIVASKKLALATGEAVVSAALTATKQEGDGTELALELAVKVVGRGLGIAAGMATGGVTAAAACAPLLVGAITDVVAYMKTRIQYAPKKPSFLPELEWTQSYMDVLKRVEERARDSMERGGEAFEFSPVTMASMRRIMCAIGTMEQYWGTLKQTFSVDLGTQATMTDVENAATHQLKAGVEHLDKAIQLEQMRMLSILGTDLKGKKTVALEKIDAKIETEWEKGVAGGWRAADAHREEDLEPEDTDKMLTNELVREEIDQLIEDTN